MKNSKMKVCILFLLAAGLAGLRAQTAIATAGGNASGSGGSVSYTVGQVVYHTTSGTNGSVTEGVQQPFEISVVTGLETGNLMSLSIVAYPNPATDYITLKVDASIQLNTTSVNYRLYDLNGKILETGKLQDSETRIRMSNRLAGSYLLKIICQQDNISKQLKTFKIIKH